jgi:hypothetical protein
VPGCGAPTPDASTETGKRQIIDQAVKALTTSDCATALDLLLPVYNSANTDNEIRLVTASAYGCWAGINYFKLLGDMVQNSASLTSSGGGFFWILSSSLFPSTSGQDYVAEGAMLGTDALMASLKFGVPVLPSAQINAGSYNVGSIYGNDRIDDANLYLLFISWAGIGGLQNRYGSPTSSYHRGALLPWNTAAGVTSDGAAYVSSIMNFVDAIGLSKNILPSSLSSTLTTLQSGFTTSLDAACNYGCANTKPPAVLPVNNGNWVQSGCTLGLSGCPNSKCPDALRDRSRITGQASDINSCAAAGVVNFINSSTVGWQ